MAHAKGGLYQFMIRLVLPGTSKCCIHSTNWFMQKNSSGEHCRYIYHDELDKFYIWYFRLFQFINSAHWKHKRTKWSTHRDPLDYQNDIVYRLYGLCIIWFLFFYSLIHWFIVSRLLYFIPEAQFEAFCVHPGARLSHTCEIDSWSPRHSSSGRSWCQVHERSGTWLCTTQPRPSHAALPCSFQSRTHNH